MGFVSIFLCAKKPGFGALGRAYILAFILPLPLAILACFRAARLACASLADGAPLVNTSPAGTAPPGLPGTGAVPLGTALGEAVPALGAVWAGVV
ncbi:hypothetical protein BEN49_03770 [Hymenobacter coccineus]|uniref:Uncharacterized protein n=1 Tax=Hymenobacter coccineus TaxID=1908235 RepID=A0A1G1TMQ0_9BACT|nr:hypothetical protein BEN49_03770 [Hymenobacter coccineus]